MDGFDVDVDLALLATQRAGVVRRSGDARIQCGATADEIGQGFAEAEGFGIGIGGTGRVGGSAVAAGVPATDLGAVRPGGVCGRQGEAERGGEWRQEGSQGHVGKLDCRRMAVS